MALPQNLRVESAILPSRPAISDIRQCMIAGLLAFTTLLATAAANLTFFDIPSGFSLFIVMLSFIRGSLCIAVLIDGCRSIAENSNQLQYMIDTPGESLVDKPLEVGR